MKLILVLIGGGLGAAVRFGVSRWFGRHTTTRFPWGTMAVNLFGCVIIGVLAQSPWIPASLRWFAEVGFVGALTTFSTFSYETIWLMETREVPSALANIGLSLGLGLGGVALGAWLGGLFA